MNKKRKPDEPIDMYNSTPEEFMNHIIHEDDKPPWLMTLLIVIGVIVAIGLILVGGYHLVNYLVSIFIMDFYTQ